MLRRGYRKLLARVASVRLKDAWKLASDLAGWFYTILIRLPWVVALVVIGVAFVQSLTRETTVIDSISVPKQLADNGYSQDVVARHIRDAMDDFIRKSNWRMGNGLLIVPHHEVPDIIVPQVGLSLEAMASVIRTFLRGTRSHSITGEITIKDKLLWFRWRIDGADFQTLPTGYEPEKLDDLFAAAAGQIIAYVRPYLIAVALYRDDKEAGIRKADEIIATLPESDENVAFAYSLKSFYHDDRKEYDLAERFAGKAVQLNPALATAHFGLAIVYDDEKKYDAALSEYRKAIALDPDFASAYTGLGNILSYQGKYDQAIEAYRKVIAVSSRNDKIPVVTAYNILGGTYAQQKKFDEAIGEFRKAIAVEPKNAAAYIQLGLIYTIKEEYAAAIDAYQKATALEPNSATLHRSLGLLYFQQEKFDEAIAEYHRAFALKPDDALIHSQLGDILMKLQRSDEAIEQYNAALAIDPNLNDVRSRLENLRAEHAKAR